MYSIGAFHKGDRGLSKSMASFVNPFLSGRMCHWIICPSHQMKNMISALHSSHPQRAKLFERSGVKFGWEDIELLKQREDERSLSGQMRFVPGLLSSYIERDSWTKLNVKPSKIFQQDAVLSELFSHANSVNQGNCSAMQVYKYLLAINKIFERGLLSKYPVYNMSSPIISGITEGYQYFLDWLNESNCNAEHDKKQIFSLADMGFAYNSTVWNEVIG